MAMNETFSPPDMPPPGPTAPLNGPARSLRKCADDDAAAANANSSRPAGTALSHRDGSGNTHGRGGVKEGGEQASQCRA